jgi:SAM-dependent methyltransferase
MPLSQALLSRFCLDPKTVESAASSEPARPALSLLLRVYPELLERIRGRRVLDFGCGPGTQAVALAVAGAARVVGVDLNPRGLEEARRTAEEHGVSGRVQFVQALGSEYCGGFELVVSQNSMEHFRDPEAILRTMANALAPKGEMLVTFGPPWFAPYGAHMYYFTRLPWVHLIFHERTIMAVRGRYRQDGAIRYEDVEGGLNQMSVRKFKRLINVCGLQVVRVSTEPVKGQRLLSKIPFLGEMFTNHVTAVLRRDA